MTEIFDLVDRIKTDPELLKKLAEAAKTAQQEIEKLQKERRIDPKELNIPLDAALYGKPVSD